MPLLHIMYVLYQSITTYKVAFWVERRVCIKKNQSFIETCIKIGEHFRCKQRHIGKYERLKNKSTTVSEVKDTSTPHDNTDRWVVNLSDKQLTDAEKGLLAKGLNFSVTPPHIPVDDFVVCTEKAAGILGKHSANAVELRAKVVGIIKHAKPPVSNISRDEREALKNLKADKDIIVLPADKGRASVVLNKQDY